MRPTKGRVLIRIEEFETIKEGFETRPTVPERHGVVTDMGVPFDQFGHPGYTIGDRVKIPESGGKYFKEGEEDYVVFMQQEIVLYDPV